MRRDPLPLLAVLMGLAFVASCAAALRQPLPQDVAAVSAQWPGTTLADLERGRSLYVKRCSGCHTLVLPQEHPPARWPRLVDEMVEESRLLGRDRDDVVRFLVAVASEPEPGRPSTEETGPAHGSAAP